MQGGRELDLGDELRMRDLGDVGAVKEGGVEE